MCVPYLIKFRYKTSYSAVDLTLRAEIVGSEVLPLGKTFQNHIIQSFNLGGAPLVANFNFSKGEMHLPSSVAKNSEENITVFGNKLKFNDTS